MTHPLRRLRLTHLMLVLGVASCGVPDLPEEGLSRQTMSLPAAVEQWRKLVEKYFKYQHVTWALNIIKCESGGDPNAYNPSGASGLFQHMKQYWAARATAAGFPGASVFDPEANIAASAYLLYKSGKGQWSCTFSPYEDFNYVPQFYKDGVAVGPGTGTGSGSGSTCTPSCSGSKLTGEDCAVTDCATSGETCIDDGAGARCASTACPASGQKKICISTEQLGQCSSGVLTPGTDCAAADGFCSTAGNTEARCVAHACAAGPTVITFQHDVCLADGRLARCTAIGAVEGAKSCASGEVCVTTTGGASCRSSANPDTPDPSPGPSPSPGGSLPEQGGSTPSPTTPSTQGGGTSSGGDSVLVGACNLGPSSPTGAPLPIGLLPLAFLLGLRRLTRRGS